MLVAFPTHLRPLPQHARVIRELHQTDIPRILEIDEECFTPHLTGEQIFNLLQNYKNLVWKVIEVNGEIVGFFLYEHRTHDIRLLRLGITRAHRRKGYASFLLKDAYRHLNCNCNKLTCRISEWADGAIAWAKRMGFQATAVIKNGCEDGVTDCYCFRLVLPESTMNTSMIGTGV